MTASTPRITQRMIADMAGVSQSTVSLVVNGKAGGLRRIPEATRDRILAVVRDTTYVANPVARSLVGSSNDLIGVFTYEPAFPNSSSDFYTPLLTGIEHAAERASSDLLVFTSTPVVEGRRTLFHESNRLRLADGCILLGREMDADELEKLLDTAYPFVAIGRRDAGAGRISYIGVDYAAATRELADRALRLGHRRFALLRLSLAAESSRDRADGIRSALTAAGFDPASALHEVEVTAERSIVDAWRDAAVSDPSTVFVEDPDDAERLLEHFAKSGTAVPDDVSVVALGEHRRSRDRGTDVTRLRAPRPELGVRAVEALSSLIAAVAAGTSPPVIRELLPCRIVGGTTLGPPRT